MKFKELKINSPSDLPILPFLYRMELAADRLNKGTENYDDEDLNMITFIAITNKLSFNFLRGMAKSLYKDDEDKFLAVNDFISMLEDKYCKHMED